MKQILGIDLDSDEFEEKVGIALTDADGMSTIIPNMMGREQKELQNFLFLLGNTRSSNMKHCKACGANHYIFIKDFEPKSDKATTCLCPQCSNIGLLMVFFKMDGQRIKEWMLSEGKIDPYTLMRDGVDTFIKEGKITVEQRPQIDKQSKEKD